MNIALYVIAGLLAASALLNVSQVGKPRKPVTPGLAAAIVLIDAAIIVILVIVAGQH